MSQIKITALANMGAAEAQFKALRTQVALLNQELAETSMIPSGSPAQFTRQARAAGAVSTAYSHALASSGAFRVEQVKISSAVDDTTKKLALQKLKFHEVFGKKSKPMMDAVYLEQIRMQQSVTRLQDDLVSDGKQKLQVGVPTHVHQSWDTLSNKVGFFRERLASASAEMINWGKNTQWAGRQLMAGISMPIAAFGAAAGVMAYQVDQELTRIAKVYDTVADQNSDSLREQGKAEAELTALRQASLDTAQKSAREYGASTTDTLKAQADLASSGQSGLRLQESTIEVMRIATLGEIDQAQATQALISLQAILGHTVSQTADDFNYLNAIENATSLTTDDFTEAIPRALGPMKEMGGTLQDLGVLMVAMKERGVDAAEGANAIKSMMQRLYRPSEQVRAEWQKMAGVDPLEFIEKGSGNVMEILPMVADAVRDVDKASRVKMLSGLFGTYQVARMSAMLKGLDDLKEGVGQTTTAFEVGSQDASVNATIAAQELAAQAESASGRFKRAWEQVRAELAEIGEPFLLAASKFLELTNVVFAFFNNMPDWIKTGVAWSAMFLAVIGPLVMIIGLLANLKGNMGKFVAWMLKGVGSFELFSKAQWHMKASAALAGDEFVTQAKAAQILEGRIRGLTLALEEQAVMTAARGGPAVSPALQAQIDARADNPAVAQNGIAPKAPPAFIGMPGGLRAPVERQIDLKPVTIGGKTMEVIQAESLASMKARQVEAAALAQQERTRLSLASEMNSKAEAERRIRQGTASAMSGAAVSMGVMAIAGTTMMVTSNETANSIAKWAMVMAMVVPAMSGLGPVMTGMSLRAGEAAKKFKDARVQSIAAAGATAKAAGYGRTLATSIGGVARGFSAMLGPIGWVTLGITAVAGILMKVNQHNKEIEEAQKRQMANQAGLVSQSKEWAATQSEVVDSWRKFKEMNISPEEQTQIDTDVAFYKSDEQKDKTAAFNDDDLTDIERRNILILKYVDSIKSVGLSADEAKNNIVAFLNATGLGMSQAIAQANELQNEIGVLKQTDWIEIFDTTHVNLVESVMDGNDALAEEYGQQIGQIFVQSVLDPNNTPEESKAYMENLRGKILDPWNKLASDMRGFFEEEIHADITGGPTKEQMKDGATLRATYLAGSKEERAVMFDTVDASGQVYTNLTKSAEQTDKIETSLIGGIEGLGSGVNHWGELLADPKFLTLTLNADEAEARVDEVKAKIDSMLSPEGIAITESIVSRLNPEMDTAEVEEAAKAMNELEINSALLEQNTLNMNNGLKTSNEELSPMEQYMEAVAYWMAKTVDDTKELTENARRAKNELNGVEMDFTFDAEDMKTIYKEGMQGVQSDLSDMLTEDFDSRMKSGIESNVSYWDTAIENMQESQEKAQEELSRTQEREQNQFDNRWERRTTAVEKAYDSRIEKINDTIEAEQEAEEIRQKIFAAEQSRLDRLTDTANTTIDFNMALQTGDLDEAAKIRNDMEAAAVGWALSDAADESTTKAERRQDRLEERSDRIEDKKDASLKALEKREEAERKSLERRQENEQEHLDKIQKMNMESLQDQAANAKEVYAEDWENRRDSLDDQLETFKSFVPKNQKQLRAWMDEMDIDYENFGIDTLKPKSKEWGTFFKDSLTENVRKAGIKVGSDDMWENTGAKVAKKMLSGMGFGNIAKFTKFITTGELPTDFGKPKPIEDTPGMGNNQLAAWNESRHEGGVIGGGTGSRKGVAKNLRGLHPSEVMVRAQKKEFMVNRTSAEKYGPELEAINKGIYDPTRGVMGGSGMAGFMSAAMAAMFNVGVTRGIQNVVDSKYAQTMAQQTGFTLGSIKAGEYGDSSFTAEQLSNAKTISSVGLSLGATSRDIIIALMTAMQESGLRNLDYGDLDSVGLFQQRDAWGTTAARTNPAEATRMFFLGGNAGQRGLFDFADRASMSLSEAAQSVQVSAYPDAYAKWEDEAKSIFSALRTSGTSNSSYVPGPGGSSRPVKGPFRYGDIHGTSTGFPAIDFGTPTGIPIYAVGDGVISRSEDIRGPLPTDTYRGDGPYGSYGRVIQLRLDSGAEVLYAHLSERGVAAGTRVAGGSMIGRTGNTGNSSGSHLHFGATNGPLTWLKTGGQTINDGIAMLHRGETVLTKPLTDDLNATVRAFGKSSKEILSGRRGGSREGQLEKAKTFARNQVGKPYAWGQEGPNGYDCSGLQSAIINVIKGNHPYNRLFATGNMAEVIPNLGFKRGNGGKSDYSVGWFTGDPGHTSGRIGDMGIESTGNAVRSQGATPVGAFPNQWHLPLTSVAAQTSTNPVGINKNSKESRKAPVTPWTKEDGINSPAEGWGKETMVAEVAMSPFWTYANSAAAAPAANAVSNTIAANLDAGTGNKAGLQIGTLNTWVGASADATITDVGRLIPGADFLGLTEMGTKFAAVKKFLAKQNWGAVGGGSRDQSMNMMAYNKNTQELVRSGQRKLGDKMADVVGGREKRYANYGLFTDKESGRNTWQVAAHTVPAGRGLNPKNAPLYYEQWKNLNGLVDELSGSAPVFVSGDLNVHKGASNFQTPGNLDEFASQGVDYVFGNKKLAELQRQWTVSGMHTDHGGKALMSNFSLPSHKNGAENIMWDNTLVNMHKNESILTADQSNKFRRLADNIDNVAGGGSNEYNVNVYVTDAAADADQIANKVITKLKTMESRRPTRRRS